VGIGMGATDYQQPMHEPFPLAHMTLPVLDIYGSHDYPAVVAMAPERLAMMRTGGHPQSKQQVITEADHYYAGKSKELIDAVASWLNGLALASGE